MAIELDLTVEDKASATVARAANNMAGSLDRARLHAERLSGSFASIGARVSGIASGLLRWQTVMGGLAAAVGAGYLAKQAIELGLNAQNADLLRERTEGLGAAWQGFLGRIGEYVAQSPAVHQGLADMTQLVGDWGTALTENKDVIEDWLNFAREAIKGVGEALTAGITAIAKFSRNAPIANMTMDQAEQQLQDALRGQLPAGYTGGTGGATSSEAYWASQSPAKGSEAYWAHQVTQGMTVNFNGAYSRSDVLNVINEMERRAYRSEPPPDASFED